MGSGLQRGPASTARKLERAVLCVDLDGTLLRTNSLCETLLVALQRRPAVFFQAFFWALRGLAYLKARLAKFGELDFTVLPYCEDLLTYLRRERASGRRIVLVTAADQKVAAGVAAHLGIFDDVLASDGRRNLTGHDRLEALASRYGKEGFDYAGSSWADIPIWRRAGRAIPVGVSSRLQRRLEGDQIAIERAFSDGKSIFALLAAALRVHQWSKNFLIFVPLLLSHRAFEAEFIYRTFLAFAAFCLCASGVYITNDLRDLAADRRHQRKRSRPFAAGYLPLWAGMFAAPILIAAGFLMAQFLPVDFALLLALYVALATVYTFHLKTLLLTDVIVLAGLYVLRVFAGGAATGIRISFWTVGYCLFMFLSLAILKRYIELRTLKSADRPVTSGRGYAIEDNSILACYGAASGCLAALLLALYIESNEVRLLYREPRWLWMLCVVHLHWVIRVWLLANRGQVHDDPVMFALKDRSSYAMGVVAVSLAAMAK